MAVRGRGALSKATTIKALDDDTDDNAIVIEETHKTKTYKEKAPKENESENKGTKNKGDNKDATDSPKSLPFVPTSYQSTLPTNRLARMFEEIKDYEDEDGETFYAMITRRQDMMQDGFRKPCMAAMNFEVMQIGSHMMPQFIPMLQKANGNSGGRFDVVICDENYESTDIGLTNFVIPDPIIEETAPLSGDNGNDFLRIIQEMNRANDEKFEKMIEAMRPKDDEFTNIVKEKIRQDILDPPKSNDNFNMESIMTQVMGSMAVMNAMGEGFSKMFNRENSGDKEKGLLETLLTNDAFLERATEIYEHTTNTLADLAVNLKGNQPTGHVNNPNMEYEPEQPYPSLTPQEQQEMNEKAQTVTAKILEEIESDRPLNADNETLIELQKEYPDIYEILTVACKGLPFEQLLGQLRGLAPDAFADFLNEDGSFNDRGNKAIDRLKEFYEFMKTL